MSNLIAYIPALNQRHLEWFKRHPESELLLITQATAQMLVPRLARNIVAMPTKQMRICIQALGVVKDVDFTHSVLKNRRDKKWILPDEDVSREFAKKMLERQGGEFSFEMIWARYDMTAVLANQPVMADMVVSSLEFHREIIGKLEQVAQQSPDIWRQVAAAGFSSTGELLAMKCNTHMPTEYETDLFGDPSINRDAGQKGRSCAHHAETGLIDYCARYGRALEGGWVYVTIFPCEDCARRIAAAGLKKVYFKDGYSSLNAQEVLRAEKVEIIRIV